MKQQFVAVCDMGAMAYSSNSREINKRFICKKVGQIKKESGSFPLAASAADSA